MPETAHPAVPALLGLEAAIDERVEAATLKHPECLHPVANSSDDYSGVTCCCCDQRPCTDVDVTRLVAHHKWERQFWEEAGYARVPF